MKNARHSKILELIGQHSIDKQEELLAHLRRSGFEVTQATAGYPGTGACQSRHRGWALPLCRGLRRR